MCSRYCLTSPPSAVREFLATTNEEQFPARVNIAPTQPVHIARIDHRGQRRLDLVRWGLIPGWVKNFGEFALLFSARSEGALEKPTFRAGLNYRRCLVPADGYTQWTGPRSARQPHLVTPVRSGLMAFAGIWEHWLGADGSELESMAILTVAAGPDVAQLHDRMPAILAPGQFACWLDTRACRADEAAKFLRPAPSDTLHFAPANPASGSAPDDALDPPEAPDAIP